MRYCLIISAIYVLLVLLFLVFLLKGAGHGWNPFGFVSYLSFPAGFLLELLPMSWLGNGLPVFFLFVLVGLIQWAIIGFVIDKLVAWRRAKSRASGGGRF